MRQAGNAIIPVEGNVEPKFAAVVDAFIANFERYQEAGAALAVYHRGELVVARGAVAWTGRGHGSRERLGFLLPTQWCPLGGGGAGSFGTAGFGGSRAWANPDLELAFPYVPNLCSLTHFDAREAALSRAAVNCATRVRTVDRIGGLGL